MTSHAAQSTPPASPEVRAGTPIPPVLAGAAGETPVPERIGPYFVYESLGSGGMATVRRAELRSIAGFRRMVALKQLHPHLARIPAMRALFVQEARLGSQVRHANVAQTFDFGKVGNTYFIAMEYVRGPTLAQVARQCAAAAGPVPFAIVLGIIGQLCDALEHIHNLRDQQDQPLGIVHRDVSPPNAIISNTGIVKLIDFGISKAESVRIRSQARALGGKFGYCAPESVRGPVDARADLFSLGVIAYELISSRPLFHGRDDRDTLARVCEMPIPPLSCDGRDVPRELASVVMKALERDPERRWQTAGEMRAALTEIVRGSDVHVGPPQILEWVEWAFSQRGADPEDTRTNPVAPPGASPIVAAGASPAGSSSSLPAASASHSGARPAVALPPHELSTVVVLPGPFGGVATRVFQRDMVEPAPRRQPRASSAFGDDRPTTKYPRGEALANLPPRPSRTTTGGRRKGPVEPAPRAGRSRRRLRAPVLSPALGSTAVPAGLTPRRRLGFDTTAPATSPLSASTGAGRQPSGVVRVPRGADSDGADRPSADRTRASRTSDIAFSATQLAVPVLASAAARAPARSVSSAVPAVSPPAQRAPSDPRRDAAPSGSRHHPSTGVVVVPPTRRTRAVAGTPLLRLRADLVRTLRSSWPLVAVVCAVLVALAFLVLR